MSGFKGFPKIDHSAMMQRFKENLKGSQNRDDRFYRLTKDATNQGAATIRFLPGKEVGGKEQLYYEPIFRHSLNLNGKKSNYNCICPTTIGKPCPICDWNKMQEGNFVFDNGFYRQRKFISNILIIDEKTEDLVGKVKLFEYGPQIMKLLEAKLFPKEIAGKKKAPLLYYDWEAGANFELILVKEASKAFPSWEQSEFLVPSSIMDFLEDKNINPNEIIDSLFDLKEVVNNLEVLSYETIKREFYTWLDSVGLSRTASTSVDSNINARSSELQNAKSNALATAVEVAQEEDESADIEKVAGSSKAQSAVEEIPADKPKGGAKSFKDFLDKSKSEKK